MLETKDIAAKNPLAEQAIAKISEHKKPHRKLEDWRYTKFSDFTLVNHESKASDTFFNFAEYDPSLTFNNISYKQEALPEGLSIDSLKDQSFFHKMNSSYNDTNYMSLFGLSLSAEVLSLNITKDLDRPFNILSLAAPNKKQAGLHAKTIAITLAKKTRASLNFFNISLENAKSFENLWIEVAEGAELDLSFLQEHIDSEYFGKVMIYCKKNSKLGLTCLDTGAKVQKQEIHVYLDGENIDCHLNGAYCLNGKDHVENFIRLHHLKEGSQSSQLFKGLLDEKSRGIFDGQIFVAKGADQTNARQLNKNLLLSSFAEVNTKPQLQIYADDVKCSHGATISRFLQEQVFYFQARGIKPEKAVNLLAKGFLNDALVLIKDNATKVIFNKHLTKKVKQLQVSYDT